MELKEIIEHGLVDELKGLLSLRPEMSNKKIVWGDKQEIETDPLHYVSDCVFNGILSNGNEAEIARVLIEYGAKIDGNENSESPLIGAISLLSESVATVLLDAGADINAISVHGANSLHWASYVGLPGIVSILLSKGADIEKKCIEFEATPLFWAVQGFRKSNNDDKSNIVKSAKLLVSCGANVNAVNFQNISALEYAKKIGDIALVNAIESRI